MDAYVKLTKFINDQVKDSSYKNIDFVIEYLPITKLKYGAIEHKLSLDVAIVPTVSELFDATSNYRLQVEAIDIRTLLRQNIKRIMKDTHKISFNNHYTKWLTKSLTDYELTVKVAFDEIKKNTKAAKNGNNVVIRLICEYPENEKVVETLLKANAKSTSKKVKHVVQDRLFKGKYECKANMVLNPYIPSSPKSSFNTWKAHERYPKDDVVKELDILFGLFDSEKKGDTHEFSTMFWEYVENARTVTYPFYPTNFTLYLSKDEVYKLSFVNDDMIKVKNIEVIYEDK